MVSRMAKTPGISRFGFTPVVVTASIRDWTSMDLGALGGTSKYLNRRVCLGC